MNILPILSKVVDVLIVIFSLFCFFSIVDESQKTRMFFDIGDTFHIFLAVSVLLWPFVTIRLKNKMVERAIADKSNMLAIFAVLSPVLIFPALFVISMWVSLLFVSIIGIFI